MCINNKKRILIIGAGYLQSFVIKRAKELGYTVYAVDGNPNAVGFLDADFSSCINIIDKEACLVYAREHDVNGVITAATDYGVLTASYIAEQLNLTGLKYETAQKVKNKYLIRKCLWENKVDDTQQAYEITKNTDINVLSKKINFPVMVKPCDGSGSRGANKANCIEELLSVCKHAMNSSITCRVEIESFIDGSEYGVESFVENGNTHILAIMKKHMTEPPFYAELGHEYPSGLSFDLENKIKECVTKAIEALEINFGSVNMDLLITKEGKIHIVDVGARMGGNLIGSHIIPLATGIDYMANIIRAAVGDEFTFKALYEHCVATRLLALTPGVVKKLPNFDKIGLKYDVAIEHHLHIGDTITPYRTNLDGCGYVVATAANVKDASKNAEMAKSAIDFLIVRGGQKSVRLS